MFNSIFGGESKKTPLERLEGLRRSGGDTMRLVKETTTPADYGLMQTLISLAILSGITPEKLAEQLTTNLGAKQNGDYLLRLTKAVAEQADAEN